MYVKASNGVIESFPFDVNSLKQTYSHVSFPQVLTNTLLSHFNVYPVLVEDLPVLGKNEVAEQKPYPELLNTVWRLGWTVREKTQEELDEEKAEARLTRNLILSSCDWTQLADAPLTAEEKTNWTNYRQALRDWPQDPLFPDNRPLGTDYGIID